MKLWTSLSLVLVLTWSMAACNMATTSTSANNSGPTVTPTPIPANAVNIANSAFSPQNRTISVGTNLTWTNTDSIDHSIVSDNSDFTASGALSNAGTFSRTFNATGTFPYHCGIHSSMTGTITVQ